MAGFLAFVACISGLSAYLATDVRDRVEAREEMEWTQSDEPLSSLNYTNLYWRRLVEGFFDAALIWLNAGEQRGFAAGTHDEVRVGRRRRLAAPLLWVQQWRPVD